MESLPVDAFVPTVRQSLARGHVAITAEPGAGKTTRVPAALLDVIKGEIWVTEPRRLAARMAAARVASERGEVLGKRIGYQVRFEQAASAETRLRFVTEGILLRRLAADPDLKGIDCVVFDEFHERNLDGDVCLALARAISLRRPEFRIVVMSATLEVAPIVSYLACAAIAVPGRQFPVALHYDTRHVDKPDEIQIRAAVKDELKQSAGDILVFVPGVYEIERARTALRELPNASELDLLPLHGGLSPKEQDRAVTRGAKRKVIVSTNVAESSITIDSVTAVVDSGWVRAASYSPWSGLSVFRTEKAAQAAVDQRAGRAGRTGPGRCVRLFSERDYLERAKQPAPEVERADLTQVALVLWNAGHNPNSFPWFEAPSDAALAAASELLQLLQAIDENGLTPIGKRMIEWPLHPRLGRMVIEGERQGVARDALIAAAILSETEGRRARDDARVTGRSDVEDAVDKFHEGHGLDPRTRSSVERLLDRLGRKLENQKNLSAEDSERRLCRAVLSGYPDRLARRRPKHPGELVLANGKTALIDRGSIVKDAELVTVLDAEERNGAVWARLLSAVEPEWVLDSPRLEDDSQLQWNAEREQVEVVSRMRIGAVVIDEARRAPNSDEALLAGKVMAKALLARGLDRVIDVARLEGFLSRLAFARAQCPDRNLPMLSLGDAEALLASLCEGITSRAELDKTDIEAALRARIDAEHGHFLRKVAPERLELPSKRSADIHYETDKPPWLASRLQDFFGWSESPRIADGRVPLTLHLLAPNQRAVQVTNDLAGFWDTHYPAIKKELSRRYPRHAWPENPRIAQPPMKKKR